MLIKNSILFIEVSTNDTLHNILDEISSQGAAVKNEDIVTISNVSSEPIRIAGIFINYQNFRNSTANSLVIPPNTNVSLIVNITATNSLIDSIIIAGTRGDTLCQIARVDSDQDIDDLLYSNNITMAQSDQLIIVNTNPVSEIYITGIFDGYGGFYNCSQNQMAIPASGVATITLNIVASSSGSGGMHSA